MRFVLSPLAFIDFAALVAEPAHALADPVDEFAFVNRPVFEGQRADTIGLVVFESADVSFAAGIVDSADS